MADSPPPPKPKPGSLRDRIAAFEKPAGKAAPAPPPLRPKPAGAVSWKPKPPSPPAESGSFSSAGQGEGGANSPTGGGGMSASDAKESIGRGGSLKERMAALQGRGAFGAPSPAPTPSVGTGKKWVPPPKPVEIEEEDTVTAAPDRGNVEGESAAGDTPKPFEVDAKDKDKNEEAGEEEAKADPEEEERQRRAAIAARMARLGGARVGMAPPVFGVKPPIKKRTSEDAASVKSQGSEGTPASPPTSPPIPAASLGTSTASPATSPSIPSASLNTIPVADPESEKPDLAASATELRSPPAENTATPVIDRDADSHAPNPGDALSPTTTPSAPAPTTGALSPPSAADAEAHAPKPTMAMPVPAAPRRAAPPRKKRGVSPMPPVRATEEAQVEPAEGEADPAVHDQAEPAAQDKGEVLAPAPEDDAQGHEDIPPHEENGAQTVAEVPLFAKDDPEKPAQETPLSAKDEREEQSTSLPEPKSFQAEPIPAHKEPIPSDAEDEFVTPAEEPASFIGSTKEVTEEETVAPAPVVVAEVVLAFHEQDPEPKPAVEAAEPTPLAAPTGGFTQQQEQQHGQGQERELAVAQEPEQEHAQVRALEPEPAAEVAEVDEEAQEEAARRQRVMERMARMGGVNPLGGRPSPPVRKATTDAEVSVPARKPTGDEQAHDEQDQHQPMHEESQGPEQQEPEEVDEEAEEAARRRRVMERMSKMGGVNPFAAAPGMMRRESGDSVPQKDSGNDAGLPTSNEVQPEGEADEQGGRGHGERESAPSPPALGESDEETESRRLRRRRGLCCPRPHPRVLQNTVVQFRNRLDTSQTRERKIRSRCPRILARFRLRRLMSRRRSCCPRPRLRAPWIITAQSRLRPRWLMWRRMRMRTYRPRRHPRALWSNAAQSRLRLALWLCPSLPRLRWGRAKRKWRVDTNWKRRRRRRRPRLRPAQPTCAPRRLSARSRHLRPHKKWPRKRKMKITSTKRKRWKRRRHFLMGGAPSQSHRRLRPY
ncbi:hypothetical protein B0H15DRAFT_615443 [Mycena belliarum]|uniref:Uncharacterized protein n=1 Tax=Mycena belliarum TaxID=1033014 RepID=A0AAD6XML8_9AGAR|nr:hypothetical protein B0H15DRAFT_615443 [Mycena belliae]